MSYCVVKWFWDTKCYCTNFCTLKLKFSERQKKKKGSWTAQKLLKKQNSLTHQGGNRDIAVLHHAVKTALICV